MAKAGGVNIIGSGTNIYVFKRKALAYTVEHSPIGKVTHLVAHDKIFVSIGYHPIALAKRISWLLST